MVEGKPEFNRNGTLKTVNGSVVRGEWYLSDLDVSYCQPQARVASPVVTTLYRCAGSEL